MSTAGCLPPLALGPCQILGAGPRATLIGSLLSRSARLLRLISLQSSPNTKLNKDALHPCPILRRGHEVENWNLAQPRDTGEGE